MSFINTHNSQQKTNPRRKIWALSTRLGKLLETVGFEVTKDWFALRELERESASGVRS